MSQVGTNGSVGRVLAVNVGQVQEISWLGRTWTTAIWKAPFAGPVAVRGVNAAGDDQADRTAHGGVDKALYAYAREDEAWWEDQLGRPVELGTFGENLTVSGLAVTSAVIGERWAIGTAIVAVTQPRIPCFKLGARMNDPQFPTAFAAAGRPGAYLAIVREGTIQAGDAVQILARPDHGVTVGEVAELYHHHGAVERMLEAPELPQGWRAWATKVIAQRSRRR